MDVNVPLDDTLNAETVPLPGPSCALDTNSWLGLVGRNSLPKGPRPWAAIGEPGAVANRPSRRTRKLSISDVPTRVAASFVPVALNRMSPGCEPSGRAIVEPRSGWRWPN